MNKYVLIMLRNEYGQYLMVKKSKPPEQFGKMNFIGGKVEDGETYEQAAYRECIEESGIIPKNIREVIVYQGGEFESLGGGLFTIHVFYAETDKLEITPHEDEVDTPVWVSDWEISDKPICKKYQDNYNPLIFMDNVVKLRLFCQNHNYLTNIYGNLPPFTLTSDKGKI